MPDCDALELGKLIGPKPPLKAKETWSILVTLQVAQRVRDLALFNLALGSKLRACDLVALRIDELALNGRVRSCATLIRRKTGRPVQFEITEQTREAVGRWLERKELHKVEPLFPSRINRQRPMTTGQYARLLGSWLPAIGRDPLAYGTRSLRRTKASMIHRRTGILRAVQLLLGHTDIAISWSRLKSEYGGGSPASRLLEPADHYGATSEFEAQAAIGQPTAACQFKAFGNAARPAKEP